MSSTSLTPISFSTPTGISSATPSSGISARAYTMYGRQRDGGVRHTAEVDMAPRNVAGASDHTIVWAELMAHLTVRPGMRIS
jgi:hypothetical protein